MPMTNNLTGVCVCVCVCVTRGQKKLREKKPGQGLRMDSFRFLHMCFEDTHTHTHTHTHTYTHTHTHTYPHTHTHTPLPLSSCSRGGWCIGAIWATHYQLGETSFQCSRHIICHCPIRIVRFKSLFKWSRLSGRIHWCGKSPKHSPVDSHDVSSRGLLVSASDLEPEGCGFEPRPVGSGWSALEQGTNPSQLPERRRCCRQLTVPGLLCASPHCVYTVLSVFH